MKHLAVLFFVCAATFASAQNSGLDAALLAKATAGDPAAQVSIGEKYAAGIDVPQDLKQAVNWYRKAAAQGNAAGEILLADAYRDGRGASRDKALAADWYRKAADQGEPGAQGTLAMLYMLGQGVPQSDAEAYYWFDLAASADTPRKQQYITNRQNVGTHITADELAQVQERAAQWKAAHKR